MLPGITKAAAQLPVMDNALALDEAGQADPGVATNGLVKIIVMISDMFDI
jgi:hypothetical protein